MWNHTVIFLFVMISCFSFSQKEKSTVVLYRSLDGVKVTTCDSLSFQDRYMNSEFYIDSISGEPFTGIITRYIDDFNSDPLDSLQVVNGVLNGLQKMYLANNDIETKLLSVKFLDQNAKTRISTNFDRVKTTHIGFYDFEGHLRRYHVKFKANKIRVRLKRTLFTSEGIKKERKCMKFKTYSDFREYLKQFHIYDECKKMGILNEEFVEPMICDPC